MYRIVFFIVFFFTNGLSVSGQNRLILGKNTNSKLTEISGIIPYSFLPNYFWVHNDSGDQARIFLIDSLVDVKLEVKLEGVKAVDFEDVARVDYKGESYILIGDFGNNLRKRDTLSIYVVKEPKLDLAIRQTIVPKSDIVQIKFHYKDKNRDAEAFFVDPIDQQVYIFSKRDFKSTVFRFPLELSQRKVYKLEPLLELPFTFTTAADISIDGKSILVKNLTHIYVWNRQNNEPLLDVFKTVPNTVPYALEPQGEAIAFDLFTKHFYTISEKPFGLDSYLYKYTY